VPDFPVVEVSQGIARISGLSEEALVAWGSQLGAMLVPPVVIVLRGDLGAGKSTLARAIARGAGVTGAIPSPTYNLLFRYEPRPGLAVVHVDLYRLEREDEVWELGWAELGGPGEIVMIEWGERAEQLLPIPRWEIRLEEGSEPTSRNLEIRPVGDPSPLTLPEAP